MKKDIEILAKCPLFSGIEEIQKEEMLHCLNAKVRSFQKEQPIFLEGDPADMVGVVLAGSVKIIKEDYCGNRSIVGMAQEGELFAEVFACAAIKKMPVSVIAGLESKILFIDCKRILHTCSKSCEFHSALISNLLQIVAQKSLFLHQKIELYQKRTTKEKIMAYLLSEAKRQESHEFTIPYDRQALADYLGVERSAMSTEIGKLRKEGILQCQKSHFILKIDHRKEC